MTEKTVKKELRKMFKASREAISGIAFVIGIKGKKIKYLGYFHDAPPRNYDRILLYYSWSIHDYKYRDENQTISEFINDLVDDEFEKLLEENVIKLRR